VEDTESTSASLPRPEASFSLVLGSSDVRESPSSTLSSPVFEMSAFPFFKAPIGSYPVFH